MIVCIKNIQRKEVINMNDEQIKETTSNEVVSIQSNILFDTNMGFNPDLDFVPLTEFK